MMNPYGVQREYHLGLNELERQHGRQTGRLHEVGAERRRQDAAAARLGLMLAEVTEDIRRTFDDRVPVMVRTVDPVGRAKSWLKTAQEPGRAAIVPMPCTGASWPVVAFDGTVVACCNQGVVDGPVPPHLRLGHIAVDDWPTVRARALESPTMRAIRTFGPEYMVDRFGSGKIGCDGYCSTCFRLGDDPALAPRMEELARRPVMRLLEEQMATVRRRELEEQFFAHPYIPLMRLGV